MYTKSFVLRSFVPSIVLSVSSCPFHSTEALARVPILSQYFSRASDRVGTSKRWRCCDLTEDDSLFHWILRVRKSLELGKEDRGEQR